VRVVRRPDGSLRVGRSLPGRGAWLCAGSMACFDLAARRRSFDRALRVPISSVAVDDLRARLASCESTAGQQLAGH